MTIHELRDLVADALVHHANKPESLPGLLVVGPSQPRFPRAPLPKLVAEHERGSGRTWMWTVAQLKRLLPILDAAVAEHDAAHTFELPDVPRPSEGGRA